MPSTMDTVLGLDLTKLSENDLAIVRKAIASEIELYVVAQKALSDAARDYAVAILSEDSIARMSATNRLEEAGIRYARSAFEMNRLPITHQEK